MGTSSAEERASYKRDRQSGASQPAEPRVKAKRRPKPYAVEERWTISGFGTDWGVSKWYATVASRDEALRTLQKTNRHPHLVEYRAGERTKRL